MKPHAPRGSGRAPPSPPTLLRAPIQPLWLALAAFAAALAFFILFEADHLRSSRFWSDELFSLVVTDPKFTFAEVSRRVLSDNNAPLYFYLLHAIREVIADGRTAIVTLNGLGVAAVLGMTMWIGRRADAPAMALLSAALFLAGAPLLCYAPEGRCYALVMSVCFALGFLAATAVTDRPPNRTDFVVAGVLAAAATWLHLYGAIFACALACALVLWGLYARSADKTRLGFAIGVSSVAAFALWFAAAAPMFTHVAKDGYWLTFTPATFKESVWIAKQYSIGSTFAAPVLALFLALSIWRRRSRAIAAIAAIAGLLFVAAPLAVSFHTPIFLGRYLLVGVPGFFTLLLFALRAHVQDGVDEIGFGWAKRCAAIGAAFFLAPILTGAATAEAHFKGRWDWRGIDVIAPRIARCAAGEIRVLNSSNTSSGFDYLLGGRLRPVPAGSAPIRDVADIACPVYGWAEHYLASGADRDWTARADAPAILDAFHLTNSASLPLRIERHPGGLVLRRDEP